MLLGNDMLNQTLWTPGMADLDGFKTLRTAAETALAKASAAYTGSADDFDALRQSAGEFWDSADSALRATIDGKRDVAEALVTGKGRTNLINVLRVGGRVLGNVEDKARSFLADADERAASSGRRMTMFTTLTLVIGVVLTWVIGRSVTLPLGQ